MKLFYSFELQKNHTSKVLDDIKNQLDKFSDAEQLQPSTSSPHYELYETTEDKQYKFYWIGIRLNLSARLIGAIASGTSLPGRYFFALEVIETHDYQKSLVENVQRRKNWQTFIQQFMDDVVNNSRLKQDAVFEQTLSGFVQHEGRFRALHAQQIEVLDAPIHQGTMCFGAPGTGKTLVAHQRVEEYMRACLTTAYIAPTPLLIDATLKEMDSRNLDRTQLRALTWVDFVLFLDAKSELTHLGFSTELKSTLVDIEFFSSWFKEQLKTASYTTQQVLKDIHPKTIPLLWHEFHGIFFQPNWSDTSLPHLNETDYLGLGIAQSNFPVKSRKDLYTHVFMPFYREIQLKKAYFPALLAHRLYNALKETQQKLFDALVVDEMQKFHPWQLACLLSTLNHPLSAGQFCLVGDAGQGVEKQALRIAEPMKLFFEMNKACVRSYCLETNHRSSQVVTRFISQIHELELQRLGSSERDTHISVRLSSQAPEGEIRIQVYDETFRHQIEQNANAYIVIPHQSMRRQACEHWASSQIVSLCEFQGMAAHTIVMYGFSEYYADQLKQINATTETLPDWNSTSSYARRSKGVWNALSDRECLQALYTASSRATHTLIMIENAPLITRLLKACTPVESPAISEDRPMTMNEVPLSPSQQSQVKTDRPKCSLKDWFLRAKNDFTNGLLLQAKEILCRRDLWSSAQVEIIESIFNKNEPIDWSSIESILFPKSTTTPLSPSFQSSTAMMTAALKTSPSAPLSPKWSEWVEALFNNITTTNLESLINQSNMAQLLFSHKMTNGFCLYINLFLDESKFELFNQIVLQKKKSLVINEKYNSLTNKPVLLEFIWAESHPSNKGIMSSLIQKISGTTDQSSKQPLIYGLLNTEIGVQRFIVYFNLFKKHLNALTFCCREYPSLTYLKNSTEGLKLIQKEAAFFLQKGLITTAQFEEIEYLALLKGVCISAKKATCLKASQDVRVELVSFKSEKGFEKKAVIKSQPSSLMSEQVFQQNRADLLLLYHPNIIRYIDVIRDKNQTVRLIMDYSDRGHSDCNSLDILIDKFHNTFPKNLALAFSKAVGLQLMMALSYLHRVGKTTHGSLAPEHILINTEGRVILCNVKLAKFSNLSAPTEEERYNDRVAAVKIIYALANSYTLDDTQALMTRNMDHVLKTTPYFEVEEEAVLHRFLMSIVDKTFDSSEVCLKHPFFSYENSLEIPTNIQNNAPSPFSEFYGLQPAMSFEERMKRWDEIEHAPSLHDDQKNALREWMYARVQIDQEHSIDFIKTEISPILFVKKPYRANSSEWVIIKSLSEHIHYVRLSESIMKRFKIDNLGDPMCVIKSLPLDLTNESSSSALRRAVTIMEKSHHPNIIRMLAATRDGANTVHIFCETSHLGSLKHVIDTDAIPRASMVTFLMATTSQILCALLFLHRKLLVSHRSICTEHILFFANGRVKLCSFDAKNQNQSEPNSPLSDMQQLSHMLLSLYEAIKDKGLVDAVLLKKFANFIALNTAEDALQHEFMRPFYNETYVMGDETSKHLERLKAYGIEGTPVEQLQSWRKYDEQNPTSESRFEIRGSMEAIFFEREKPAMEAIKCLLTNVPAYIDARQVPLAEVQSSSDEAPPLDHGIKL